MPQAASTPQSGVSLRTVHTGDLDPLQLVLRDFLKNQAKKKSSASLKQLDCDRFLNLSYK